MAYPSTVTPPSRFITQGTKRARYEIATRYNGIGFAPAEPIRDHIDTLNSLGLPLASIARDAGCTPDCVRNIHRGIWTTVKIRHATAIKAVTHHPNPRQQVVLAVGAVRRLQALHALGWTWTALAEYTPGTPRSSIATLTRPGFERTICAWSVWETIRDAYEQLSGTPAPDSPAATKARKAARARKWPPPLDWDGRDIDDPRVIVKPSGPAAGSSYQENTITRRGEVARLTRAGLSATEIAVRLGTNVRQVVRDRQWIKANDGMCDEVEEMSA